MATIDVKGLSKSFGHHEVISGFSLHVEDGEFLSLLGPSGCGKSTILRIVAGLEELTRGRIEIDRRDVTALEPKDRNIAMVFQNYALYPRKTIFENLAYSLRIRNVAKAQIERRVHEVATVLQIEMLLARYPSQLSGGQQQRVAMGRAMVREPAAFLFDEPLSNLDAKLRNHMRVEIRQLQKRLGTTTLYVTHDQVEAMTMSDRIVVLNQGRIEQIGRPLDIYERPASLFVAKFIGSPAMNLSEASVDGGMVVLPSGHCLAAMRGLDKGRVTVGIRPERIKLSGHKGPASLPFRISLVEELGSGKVVHGRSGDTEMIVAHPEDNPLPGGEAYIELQDGFLHYFDVDSGRRLDAVPLPAFA